MTRSIKRILAEIESLQQIRRQSTRYQRDAAIAEDTLRWVVGEMAILAPSEYLKPASVGADQPVTKEPA